MDWNSSSTSNMQSDGRIFAGKMCPLIVQGIDRSIVKLLLTFIPLSMANPDYLYYSINLFYLYARTRTMQPGIRAIFILHNSTLQGHPCKVKMRENGDQMVTPLPP